MKSLYVLYFMMVYSCFFLTFSCVSTVTVERQEAVTFSSWMSRDDYQKEFDRQLNRKFYPKQVEGREYRGRIQFRALFIEFPSERFYFYSHHGLSTAVYKKKDREYKSKGFTQIWHQKFTTSSGQTLHQGTWVKE